MLVKIQYHDNESFNTEEVVAQAKHNYGEKVSVETLPESFAPHDMIYFALQQMTVHKQLSILYNDGDLYHIKLKDLKSEILYKVSELLDEVIMDTETRVQ